MATMSRIVMEEKSEKVASSWPYCGGPWLEDSGLHRIQESVGGWKIFHCSSNGVRDILEWKMNLWYRMD